MITFSTIKQLEDSMPPCSCGGRLVVANKDKILAKRDRLSSRAIVVHFVMKCKSCGMWRGGFTGKATRVGFR